MKSIIVGLVCTGLAGSAGAATLTETYSSLWVFGDSLSDPGNRYEQTGGTTPPSYFEGEEPSVATPYFRGRYSDGFVFADYLTRQFDEAGAPVDNYAYGGARAVPNETGADADDVPDFPAQIDMFEAEALDSLGDRPLAQVLFGGNDIFAAAVSDDPAAGGSAAAEATLDGLERLYDLGIRDFAVGNVADVGITPLYTLFAPVLRPDAQEAVAAFNERLAAGLSEFDLPGSRTTFVDRFGYYDNLQETAAGIGIEEVTQPCYYPSDAAAEAAGQPRLCEEPGGFFFFDQVHPSSTVHAAYAAQVEDAILAPVPLPASGLFALAGLGMLGGVGRMRRGRRA